MGLDMYLTAERYLSDYCEADKPLIKQLKPIKIGGKPIQKITVEVAYWRKANAIHRWFVDNVQEGVDDCKRYYVSREDLSSLLDAVQLVLEDASLAEQVLPTTSGFFFGGVEYNDYYIDDLNATRDQLQPIFDKPEQYEGCDFYYQSSW